MRREYDFSRAVRGKHAGQQFRVIGDQHTRKNPTEELASKIQYGALMLIATVDSIDGVPIRLTEERWEHIVDRHPYMSSYCDDVLDAVTDPEYILRGHGGALVAVETLGRQKYLEVMYRELGKRDGFIITAYISPKLDKSRIIWRR